MSKEIENEDFEIGKVYYCYFYHLITIDELFNQQTTTIDALIKKKLNNDKSIKNETMKTFLKYMGNGIFCEYYTHKYVLARNLQLEDWFYPNILFMINKTKIQSMDNKDFELILDDICKQEKYLSTITEVFDFLFESKQNRLTNIVNNAWEDALVEDKVRTRLLQLKEVPVFEKK